MDLAIKNKINNKLGLYKHHKNEINKIVYWSVKAWGAGKGSGTFKEGRDASLPQSGRHSIGIKQNKIVDYEVNCKQIPACQHQRWASCVFFPVKHVVLFWLFWNVVKLCPMLWKLLQIAEIGRGQAETGSNNHLHYILCDVNKNMNNRSLLQNALKFTCTNLPPLQRAKGVVMVHLSVWLYVGSQLGELGCDRYIHS